MDLEFLEKVKKLAVLSMVSDDYLLDMLVLKGGTAIDLIYKIKGRVSIDIDFSIQNEFRPEDMEIIDKKIVKVLSETFSDEGLTAFDINFAQRPKKETPESNTFWGGYVIEFKVISSELYNENKKDIEFLRRNASVLGQKQKKIFKIEISKFEYCLDKIKEDLEGYVVYVYTPEMIVLEKLRAICQQLPEYKEIINSQTRTARARDFFDIYRLIERFQIDLNSEMNKEILRSIFAAKKVPINFLKKIYGQKDFHEESFASLKDTVRKDEELKEFAFYFEYVIDKIKGLDF